MSRTETYVRCVDMCLRDLAASVRDSLRSAVDNAAIVHSKGNKTAPRRYLTVAALLDVLMTARCIQLALGLERREEDNMACIRLAKNTVPSVVANSRNLKYGHLQN